jgi:hypothetical protein
MWIVVGIIEGRDKIWSGNMFGTKSELFTQYESGDEAQETADAFHLADCSFDHEKARKEVSNSKFVVRDYHTGEAYVPPSLITNKFIFDRVKQ